MPNTCGWSTISQKEPSSCVPATLIIDALMQARLVRVNRATFELEPWLAERWESSEDGRTHTLHLRPGLAWSDGTPLTSAGHVTENETLPSFVFAIRFVSPPNVVHRLLTESNPLPEKVRTVRFPGTTASGSIFEICGALYDGISVANKIRTPRHIIKRSGSKDKFYVIGSDDCAFGICFRC